jgi:hypothetical protein
VDNDANKDFYRVSVSTDEMVRGVARTTPLGQPVDRDTRASDPGRNTGALARQGMSLAP